DGEEGTVASQQDGLAQAGRGARSQGAQGEAHGRLAEPDPRPGAIRRQQLAGLGRGAMAKQGQHKGDAFDQTKSKGPNKPAQSQTITTGSYKKSETYAKQAHEGKPTNTPAQAARNERH